MGVLVDELLLLARLDEGRPVEQKSVNLAAVVRDAVDAARAVEPDRAIEVTARRSVPVTGDRAQLRQVVDNMLSNVRTHTPPRTPATVSLEAADGHAVLEVADHGPGLPDEGRDQLFNRFYRADPSRSRDRGGMGLGLSIVEAIVHAHGGKVAARQNDPQGAVFRVELPLRNGREAGEVKGAPG
jgi:two-component system OmpR family sensor kinase